MRQLIIIGILAAALVSGPACRAQTDPTDPDDSQNPKEYNQEDSNPLKIIATILNPLGYMLEWTIARPLHYLATDSPLAPAFGGLDEENDYANANVPPPMAEMPPSDMAPTGSSDLEGTTPRSATSSSSPPAHTWQPSNPPPSTSSSAPLPSQQPVMH